MAGTGVVPMMNTYIIPHFESLNFLKSFLLAFGEEKAPFPLLSKESKKLSPMSPSPLVSRQHVSRAESQGCKNMKSKKLKYLGEFSMRWIHVATQKKK